MEKGLEVRELWPKNVSGVTAVTQRDSSRTSHDCAPPLCPRLNSDTALSGSSGSVTVLLGPAGEVNEGQEKQAYMSILRTLNSQVRFE